MWVFKFVYLCRCVWAITNDLVYNNTTLEMSDGACAVVADRLFHNLTVLGKNEKACWPILEWGMLVPTCDLYDIV